jgi:hypothetical protein
MAFLREFYWCCRPYLADTARELDEAVALWAEMMALLAKAEPKIKDAAPREWARRSFELGEGFIGLTVAYAKAFLRYFQYEETLSAADRRRAQAALRAIGPALKRYARAGGYYDTVGITQFMACAARGLRSRRAAQAMLSAPSELDLLEAVKRAMQEEADALARAGKRVKLLEWRGDVDGREVIRLRGEHLEMKHDMAEPALNVTSRVVGALPEGWRAAVKPIRCRDHAYVAEQPSRANDGTITVCVEDPSDGRDIYEIEVYAVPSK